MKNVLVLYDSRYSDSIREYIYLNPEDTYYGIFVDDNLYADGDNKIINFLSVSDYLNFDDLSNIDRKSINIAKSWYIKSGHDMSTFKGISIGRVVEYDIMKIICQNLKSFILLEKIVEKEKIDVILTYGNNKYFAKGAEIIAKNRSLINEIFYKNIFKKEKHISIKSRIIKYLSNHNNYIYSISNIFNHGKTEILFVYSKRNEHLINNLSKHYRISLLTVSPIISPKVLVKKNIIVVQLKYNNLSENDNKWINKQINYFENYLRKIFDKEFIELVLLTDIKITLRKIFSFYLKYISRIKKDILSNKYKVVIVEQDFSGVSRLTTACANKLHIKTLVLQHGAYGFYPYFVSPISNYVGIWGRKWGDWFKKIGINSSKLVITGEPYYDKYFKIKKKIIKINIPLNVLIPFQPNVSISSLGEYSRNEINIIRVLNALSHFREDISITLKMRSNNDLTKGLDIVNKSYAKNVRVIGETNNYKLISKTDIIITKGSTMAFEGFLLNKIVLIENFNGIRPKSVNPFAFADASLEFHTDEELISLIKNIINDKKLINSIIEKEKIFLNSYYIKSNSLKKTLKVIENIICLIL